MKHFTVRIQSKINKIRHSPVPVQSKSGPMLISESRTLHNRALSRGRLSQSRSAWVDSVRPIRTLRFFSDSVTRVNDMSRVTIFGDLDSTPVTLRTMVTRLQSHFSQNDSCDNQWRETRVRVWASDGQTYSVCFHTKKLAFSASVMIKIGEDFLFWLYSRDMLRFCDQLWTVLNLQRGRSEILVFTGGPAWHNILTPFRGFI